MPSLTIIFLSFTAIGLLFVIFLLLFKAKKESWDKIFLFLNIILLGWIVSDIFYSRSVENIYFWSIATYLSALLLPVIFLFFCRDFLVSWKNNLAKILLFLPPLVLFIFLLVKPELMIGGVVPNLSFGPLYYIYTFYMVGYFGYSYVILTRKITKFQDIQQRQLKFVFFGSFFSSIPSLFGALILPLFDNYKLYFVSPAFILILSIFIAYAVFRHNLFNLKVITTEIFAGILLVASLIRFLISENSTEFIINGITLLTVAVFSVLLVRAIFKEVEAKEKLQKLDKAKSEFLDIASHQLRTPISVIKGVASMIKEGDMDKMPPEKRAIFIGGLWEKSRKLEEIVNDILNASEMTSVEYQINKEKAEFFDATELIKKVIGGFEPLAKEREIELVFEPSGEAVPKIYGQKDYLEEALGNLINNAIKYTPSVKKDSEARDSRVQKGRVAISIKKDGESAIIEVRDNGIGIPAAEVSELFKKFARASNAKDMYTDGSGLGLYIVKEIVEGHGGRVWLESEQNKGTRFFIRLPIKPVGETDIKKYIIEKQEVK